jgi:Nif-specific regulatory protein
MLSRDSRADCGTGDIFKPTSKFYELDKLISDGPIAQSWTAVAAGGNTPCFIKISKSSPSIDDASIISILESSFELQKLISSQSILKARRMTSENGRLFIEYPFLDQMVWRTLTPAVLGRNLPAILPMVCKIADYLHLSGMVHCDFKLENFLINDAGDFLKIILADLDYLTRAESRPNAKVFGSIEHIAPEIKDNDVILAQSDNYSLGTSLRRYLLDPQCKTNISSDAAETYWESALRFADELTNIDYNLRPRFLIDALYEHKIIGEKERRAMEKSLLAMKLLSDFKIGKRSKRKRGDGPGRIISWQNSVFGVPEELTADLDRFYAIRPLQTFRLLRSLIEKATINRYDANWQIIIEDEELIRAFGNMETALSPEGGRLFFKALEDRPSLDELCGDLLASSDDEAGLKRFMALKRILNLSDKGQGQLSRQLRSKIQIKLGYLAQTHGRTKEAAGYLADSLNNDELSEEERLRISVDVSYALLFDGRLDECGKRLEYARSLFERSDDKKGLLAILRHEAWLLMLRNRFSEAEEKISDLMEKARESGYLDELGKLLIVAGTLYWRRGEYAKAEGYFLEGLAFVEKNCPESDLISPLSNLAMLYYELAEFKKAINLAERAAKLALKLSRASRLPLIYNNLFVCYTRLGEYKKAGDWLQKYLGCKSQKHDAHFFRQFYFYQGNLLLRQNQLRRAKEKLFLSLSMYAPGEKDRLLGKLYQNLAIIALHQGRRPFFCDNVAKARDIYAGFGDEACLAEIKLLEDIEILYGSPEKDTAALLPDLDRLVGHSCRYYAALCLFHILLYADGNLRREVVAKNKELAQFVAQSEVPLFRAVTALIDGDKGATKNGIRSLSHLKTAYRYMLDSGDNFFALNICLIIAETYRDLNQSKLAGKFLLQALKLAEGLDNKPLIESIGERMRSAPLRSMERAQVLESFRRISEILGNINDYETSLTRLVEFSIHETGAERGVLLLNSDDQPKLTVKAFVNCDSACLNDIKQFSQSVCDRVSQDMNPLIIDNAKEDDRTKKYKSIIAYNILSVICLPIKIDGKLVGALYLDHHTIPALFEPDDLNFVYSIANFISVLLSAIRNQKFQTEKKRQLIADLARLGGSQKFIAQSETMNQLFSRLPEIARHNVSVLLIGESGTGKEILAQMIHDLSPRAQGPLIKLNCAAIAGSLIESELFGVAKNAATGVDEREGKLSAADGGTLFLDEIGDMPPEVQSKVLRVLEYQRFEKVGSNRTITTDIRFIYATNKDLKALIKQGKFREDLYYRINTITINIPPLRERIDDLPLLLDHFLSAFSPDENRRPRFSPAALEALAAYSWPGNVRELRNLAEKYCLLYPGRQVDLDDLPSECREKSDDKSNKRRQLEGIEKEKIRKLLISARGNQSEVSRITGIPLTTLRRKIKKYGIIKNP